MNPNDDSKVGEVPLHEAPIEEEGATQDQPDLGRPNPAEDEHAAQGSETEVDILRAELRNAAQQREQLEGELREAEDRYLRSRAELDTMRRRLQGEAEVARHEGVASALAPALAVFDDLERALVAADRADDPSSIVPGVRAVRDGLLRNLAALDVKIVGAPGEKFDPELHEALTQVPLGPGAEPGTIAQVFEAGFVKGDVLVRAARVTVYADEG